MRKVNARGGPSSAPPSHSGLTTQTNFGFLKTPQRPSFLMHELRREIVGKGSYLERGSTTAGVNGVQFDPIESIIGKDCNDLAGLKLGPAHPARADSYSKPRFGAGNDAVGRTD